MPSEQSPDSAASNLPLAQPENRSEVVNFIAAAREREASDMFISQLLQNFG